MVTMNTSTIPNKVLSIELTSISGTEYWPYNEDDPYWQGGSDPQFYRWSIDINLTAIQLHSSPFTREPLIYNALDINVGDWIASATTGKAVKIIEVTSKTDSNATLIVEDAFRYNTFSNNQQTGVGSLDTGPCIVFSLNDEGMPLLDPIPSSVNKYGFSDQLEGRFRRFKTTERIQFYKANNNFKVDDIVSFDSDFTLATSENSAKSIGRVIESGPGPDLFSVATLNKITSSSQRGLPGSVGSYLYIDPSVPGKLTDQEHGSPVYIKLSNPTPCVMKSSKTSDTTVVASGGQFKINGTLVTSSGTSYSSLVSDINLLSGTHGVVASLTLSENIAEASTANMAFGGIFLGVVPTIGSCTINGVTVNFTSDTASPGQWGEGADVANDINSANIPNIRAVFDGRLRLINSTGGSITIVNVNPDGYGNPIAGPGSATGLPLFTPATSTTHLTLADANGIEIILQDVSPSFLSNAGMFSVDNGKLPILMTISTGLREASVTVVANLAARDALNAIVGDQAYVIDAQNSDGSKSGEWALFLWDGSEWTKTSDEDSARTDANTIDTMLSFAATGTTVLGKASGDSKITQVTVNVITPFSDSSSVLNIYGRSDLIMSNDELDLSSEGSYMVTPNKYFNNTGDVVFTAVLDAKTSTSGSIQILITYQ